MSNTPLNPSVHLAPACTVTYRGHGESSTASAAEEETCGTAQLAEEAAHSALR